MNLWLSDPGYITKGGNTRKIGYTWRVENPSREHDIQRRFLSSPKLKDYEEVVRLARKAKVCVSCKCVVPPRSKHCKELNHCVYKYDHYCPYIGNAIGRENHA